MKQVLTILLNTYRYLIGIGDNMILTIYKKHLNEISAFVQDFVVPNIKTVAEEIDLLPKTWHNWSDREVKLNTDISITFCINRTGNDQTGNKHELANTIRIILKGKPIISLMQEKYAWDAKIVVRPQNDSWGGSYTFADISALVGAIRKIQSNVEFLSCLEKDALQE